MVSGKLNPDRLTGMETILAAAFGVGDGAFAWQKEKLPAVLDTLKAENIAVVGGEIWGLRGFEILPAVPTRYGYTRIFAWSAPDKCLDTDWAVYVRECVLLARQSIQDLDAESQVTPYFRHRLVYHLTFFAEQDYPVHVR